MRRFPLVFAVLALVLGVAGCGDDDDTATTATSDPPTTAAVTTVPASVPTSTTEPSPTSEPTTVPAGDPTSAVWPWSTGTVRYDDPVAAAEGFAVDFVGFVDPVVGEFLQGDARSGEVEVRPRADGPATTVFVRQLDSSDTWWVLGSATANIEIDQPEALDVVSSPVPLRGRSTAFEGTVQTEVRDDDGETLGAGFVTGGSMGDMGPFDDVLAFTEPGTTHGAVLAYTVSMEDGKVWEASVLRVSFSEA